MTTSPITAAPTATSAGAVVNTHSTRITVSDAWTSKVDYKATGKLSMSVSWKNPEWLGTWKANKDCPWTDGQPSRVGNSRTFTVDIPKGAYDRELTVRLGTDIVAKETLPQPHETGEYEGRAFDRVNVSLYSGPNGPTATITSSVTRGPCEATRDCMTSAKDKTVNCFGSTLGYARAAGSAAGSGLSRAGSALLTPRDTGVWAVKGIGSAAGSAVSGISYGARYVASSTPGIRSYVSAPSNGKTEKQN